MFGLDRVESAPSAASFQDVACAVRDGVEVELRHVVYPERHAGDASGDDVVLLRVSYPRHAEVYGCEDDRSQRLDLAVLEQAHVLEVVGLLDVADGVLDLFRGDFLIQCADYGRELHVIFDHDSVGHVADETGDRLSGNGEKSSPKK